MAERAQTIPAPSRWPNPFSMADDLVEYAVDSVQRSVLFWDVMRRRGNQAMAENPDGKPVVLVFDYEVVIDGRRLERPVNYLLLEIETPEGVEPNPTKRPFLVIDPRAGHGPGIGGSKADSQIGMALRAGHPCYFASFVQEPVPGQTIADVARAEARFLEEIARRHPEADIWLANLGPSPD